MNKVTKTAEQLAAEKEARKKARKHFDILSKYDEKSITPEAKELILRLDDEIGEYVEDALEDIRDEAEQRVEQIQGILDQISEALGTTVSEDDMKSFKMDINKRLLTIKSAMENGGYKVTEPKKTLRDLVSEKAVDLKGLTNNKQGNLVLELKAAPDFISVTGNVSPQPNAYIPAPEILPGVVAIVHPRSRILEHIRTQTINNTSIVVTNEEPGDGDFEWTLEGALKPYVDVQFITETENVKKVAAFSKLSKESLSDIPFMQSETIRIITDMYERKLAREVLNGDGATGNISGVTAFAPAYVQTCLDGRIQAPELSEVLFASATQIKNLGFEGNLIAFVNPCDWAAEMMRKNTLNELLEMNRLLEGITVVPTSEVDPDQFLIGDLSVYTLYVYEGFNINWGYENDDFRRNLVSLTAESRVFGFVPRNHRGALCFDSVSNVQSLIAVV